MDLHTLHLQDCTWCSSAKRENSNNFSFSYFCYVTQSIRISLVSLIHTVQENHSKVNTPMHTRLWRKPNSRFALEHRYPPSPGTPDAPVSLRNFKTDPVSRLSTERIKTAFHRRLSLRTVSYKRRHSEGLSKNALQISWICQNLVENRIGSSVYVVFERETLFRKSLEHKKPSKIMKTQLALRARTQVRYVDDTSRNRLRNHTSLYVGTHTTRKRQYRGCDS
jgi:hypothetical protein